MDPALHEQIYSEAQDADMEAIVKLASPSVAPQGARIVTRFGDIATCRLKVGDITEVRSDESVLSLKAPRLVGSEPDTEDFSEAQGTLTRTHSTGFTGKGVVVGIVDWGFDFTHPNFLNADGSTRFLAIWDQTAPAHASASKYGYGKVHTRQQINEALKTQNPFDALGYHPVSGDPDGSGSHGTHVTDIAAGNGAVGEQGMAPGADLAGVHLSAGKTGGLATLGDSVRILEAIDFLGNLAGDRHLVINLSVGKHGGAHQGNSLVEQGMDNFLREKPGRAIVNSAGNYFSAQIHASGRVQPGGETTLRWQVDQNDRTPNELEIWYSSRDVLRLKITLPGETSPSFIVDLGDKQDINHKGKIRGRAYHRAKEPNTGDHNIDIFLYKDAPKGVWLITLEGLDTVDGRYHAWIERDGGCRSCQSKFPDDDADPNYTTGSICNGMYNIAVGAYDPADPERRPASYSSAGPTADGRRKPNLLAPGSRIRAARSAPANAARSAGELTVKSGTSMAAPHVTGAIALLFETAGQALPIEKTRSLLLSNLDPPPAAASQAGHHYGEGYLNVESLTRAGALLSGQQKSFAMKNTPDYFQEEEGEELTSDYEYYQLPEDFSPAEEEQDRFEDEQVIDEEEAEEGPEEEFDEDEDEDFDEDLEDDEGFEESGEEDEEEDFEDGEEEDDEEEENEAFMESGADSARYESEKKPCGCHEKAAEAMHEQHWGQHEDCDECSEYLAEHTETHRGQHGDCRECGEFLVEQAEAWMEAGAGEDFMEGFFAGGTNSSEGFSLPKNGGNRARQLFDSIAFGKTGGLYGESWEQGADVVASPKSRLTNSLLPGDLVLSRSFGDGKTWQSMAVSGELLSREQAQARGLAPDSGKPGFYLEVATVQPFVRHRGEGYVRRIGDEWGRLLPDQLVLRARPQNDGWEESYPGESEPKLNEKNAIKENRTQAVKQKWDAHRQEIYKFLNLGAAPEEGAFARAVFDWQLANGFTGDDVDGVLGKNTWKKLKKAAGIITPPPITLSNPLDRILEVAYNSDIKDYPWKNRGVAKPAYIMGMALAYARVYCKYLAGDAAALEMGKANSGDAKKDALAHYAGKFTAASMSNATDGVDTLRHLFVLLTGLGMRESSGKHCVGMYHGDQNTKADTAEAGLFQTSYNIRNFFSPANKTLFDAFFVHYQNNRSTGFLDVFKLGVSCKASDAKNYGTGDGATYQELAKTCPAFAVESTAFSLRAGNIRHWAPIRDKVAEIRKECDEMLLEVQKVVDKYGLCSLFLPLVPGTTESFYLEASPLNSFGEAGGGRIKNKQEPLESDLVNVSTPWGGKRRLHLKTQHSWELMVAEARREGIAHPLLLVTSGYRTPEEQAALFKAGVKKHGSEVEAKKWVASGGRSAHQTGRTIDFWLGINNKSENVDELRQTAAYKWLEANASRFGFYPYQTEPWHWEYNPTAEQERKLTGGTVPATPTPSTGGNGSSGSFFLYDLLKEILQFIPYSFNLIFILFSDKDNNIVAEDLTDLIFFHRHPELNGRKLNASGADASLRREWKEIRQNIASPFVQRFRSGSGTPAHAPISAPPPVTPPKVTPSIGPSSGTLISTTVTHLPQAESTCEDSPGGWAHEKLKKYLIGRWNDPAIGPHFRDMAPKVFPGVPVEVFLGFAANGGVTENTVSPTNDVKFHEMGMFGTEGGRRDHDAPSKTSMKDNNWLKFHDHPMVKSLLGGRSATMEPNGWKTAIADQVAVGLVNLRERGLSISKQLDVSIRPTATDSLYFVACCFMGWSAGAGNTLKHLRRFSNELSQVTENQRWEKFLDTVAASLKSGKLASPHGGRHSHPAWSALRTWQKIAAGQLLALNTGGNSAWFDPGLGVNEKTVAETITCEGIKART